MTEDEVRMTEDKARDAVATFLQVMRRENADQFRRTRDGFCLVPWEPNVKEFLALFGEATPMGKRSGSLKVREAVAVTLVRFGIVGVPELTRRRLQGVPPLDKKAYLAELVDFAPLAANLVGLAYPILEALAKAKGNDRGLLRAQLYRDIVRPWNQKSADARFVPDLCLWCARPVFRRATDPSNWNERASFCAATCRKAHSNAHSEGESL